jgi:hypothetical protein
MSDEPTPTVEEIKDRLKVEIPIEDEPQKESPEPDVTAELKRLGRQFAETLQTAWTSEEKQRVEKEIRAGLKSFAGEVDKVIREARKSAAATKVKEEAAQVKQRVESGEVGRKARSGMVQGLQWLSEELGNLAEQFSVTEKAADEDDNEEAE